MNRTCADLAKKCGVSTATVSRVLNNSRLVRRETRDWVLQVARETGFPIDRKRTPFTVAVICSIQRGAFGGYFSLIHSAVVQALSKANVHVELVSDEELHLLDEYAIWGAINLSPLPIADFWSENFNLPLVNVNSPAQQLHRIGAVLMRDKEAIEEAYDLLWNLGHRKIAYYSCEPFKEEQQKCSGRWSAFAEQTLAHGIQQPEKSFFEGTSHSDPTQFSKILEQGYTAIFCPYEISTLYLEPHLRAAGIRIPDDLSLVQWELPLVSEYLSPARSTIVQNHEMTATEAVNLLLNMIKDAAPPQTIHVSSTFLNRQSIAIAPGSELTNTTGTDLAAKIFSVLQTHNAASCEELARALALHSNNGYFRRTLKRLLQNGQILFTDPARPRSKKQRYKIGKHL